jgi:hypothetical protein
MWVQNLKRLQETITIEEHGRQLHFLGSNFFGVTSGAFIIDEETIDIHFEQKSCPRFPLEKLMVQLDATFRSRT